MSAIVKWQGFNAYGVVVCESIGKPAAVRSAAPDLLAALVELVRIDDANDLNDSIEADICGAVPASTPRLIDALRAARAAIAKAQS